MLNILRISSPHQYQWRKSWGLFLQTSLYQHLHLKVSMIFPDRICKWHTSLFIINILLPREHSHQRKSLWSVPDLSYNKFQNVLYSQTSVHRHRCSATVNMYFSRTLLNSKVCYIPGEYYMCSTWNVLYCNKIFHKKFFYKTVAN